MLVEAKITITVFDSVFVNQNEKQSLIRTILFIKRVIVVYIIKMSWK